MPTRGIATVPGQRFRPKRRDQMVMDVDAVGHDSVPSRWFELDPSENASAAIDIQIY
jgi:hypothetical protein